MHEQQRQSALERLENIEAERGVCPLLNAVKRLASHDRKPPAEGATAGPVLDAVNALLVVTQDPKIRLHLAISDPKALAQCEAALGLPFSQKFLRVEYDPTFFGGEYHGVGEFDLISFDLLDELKRREGLDDGQAVQVAFVERHPTLNCLNIIHYTFDEPKNVEGQDSEE